MKYLLFLPLLVLPLLLSAGSSATAQAEEGIQFFHGTWAEALEKAGQEDKLIFVDAYASWCGPCKRMAASVFPQAEVGEFFNENFVNVKFDMEKPESKDFREKHRVRAYPTLFFINAGNDVVHRAVGGKQAAGLIAEGGKAITKMDDVEELAARWESEDHEPKLALRYIRALVRQGENHAKVTNDYLRAQQDLTTPENLDILLVAATTTDSRIFDLLVENKEAVIARAGEEAFDRQVKNAVVATKEKAINYDDERLLESALEKYAEVDPTGAKQFALRADFEVAARGQDLKAFQKATKKYLTKGAAGDAEQLDIIYKLGTASPFFEDEKVFEMVTEAGATSARLDVENGYKKYYRLAELMIGKKRTDEARTYAEAAKNSIDHLPAGKKKAVARSIEALLARIENAR